MRVFASDIDGCLADASEMLDARVREYFGISADQVAQNPDAFHFHDKYGLDKGEVKSFLFSDEAFDDPELWFAAAPITENIQEMSRWVLQGLVPSLITARPPRMRLVTEAWAAKYGVPYANFLLGMDDKSVGCYHIDASFMIEDQWKEAVLVAKGGFKCYLIRRTYNQQWESELDVLADIEPAYNNIIFVDNYAEIGKLEGI